MTQINFRVRKLFWMNLNQAIGSWTVVDHFGLSPDARTLRRFTILAYHRGSFRSLFTTTRHRDCREIDCSDPRKIPSGSVLFGLPIATVGNRLGQNTQELALQLP